MDRHRIGRRLLLCLAMAWLALPAAAQQSGHRELARYGAWVAQANREQRGSPLCQIQAVAKSPDPAYLGTVTVWNEIKTPGIPNPELFVAVTVTDARTGSFTRLAADHDHQFGNDRGAYRGMSRATVGGLLFLVKKSEFRALIGSPMRILLVSTRDAAGNDLTLVAPLDGIVQACARCGLLD